MRPDRTWFAALAAPLVVILGLAVLHSAPAVFLAYHLGLCLVLPVLASLHEGASLRAHARKLGLVPRGIAAGLVLGALAFAAPLAAFSLASGTFPGPEALAKVLTGWGIDPRSPGFLMVFMGLVNGPAEELFWRGWLQDRLLKGWKSGAMLVALFSSYHLFTVGALAPDRAGAVIMLGGVIAGAVFWTWSRIRWGSVWPALLTHWGATMGYMLICARLLAAG